MIAYVDSPFQLLQVYELIEERKEINKVYVRLNGKAENDKQLMSLAKLLIVGNCKFIRIMNIYEKIYYYLMFLLIGIKYSEIIIGDANSFLFKLLKIFFPKEKFILLDDGVATINDHAANKIYKRFTIFPEYVNNPITNDFKAVKKLIRGKEKNLKHVIVGSNFVDEGICSKNSYNTAIQKIIINLNLDDASCVYIPHRGETDEQILNLKNKFPIEVIKTDYPIELITFETGIIPASISHTLSTAVFSMNKIYNNADIYTFKIPSSEIISRVKSMKNLYQKIEAESFTFFIN